MQAHFFINIIIKHTHISIKPIFIYSPTNYNVSANYLSTSKSNENNVVANDEIAALVNKKIASCATHNLQLVRRTEYLAQHIEYGLSKNELMNLLPKERSVLFLCPDRKAPHLEWLDDNLISNMVQYLDFPSIINFRCKK